MLINLDKLGITIIKIFAIELGILLIIYLLLKIL